MSGEWFVGTRVRADKVEQAAAVYERAVVDGERPVKAVTEALGCSVSTAQRLIGEGRLKGLVTSKGTDMRYPKVAAVADAIGVPYEQLFDALIEHANGDIRIKAVS